MKKFITKKRDRLYCEKCDNLVNYKIVKENEIFKVKGENIEIISEKAICSECGECLYEPYLENENFKKAYSIYAKRNSLILPEDIKRIRTKYSAIQVVFAKAIGIGEATIQRYEMGSLPSKSNSDLIKSVENPSSFLETLDKNKDNLSLSDYNKISQNIKKCIEEEKGDLIEEKNTELVTLEFGEIKFDKLQGTIAAILLNLKQIGLEYTYRTKLFKLLWFVEAEYYQKYGRRLTDIEFTHLPHGPVPDNYDSLMMYFQNNKLLVERREEEEFSGKYFEVTKIFLLDESAEKYLEEKEKKTVENIISKYGNLSSRELSDISHEDDRYKNTFNGDIMRFDGLKR
jgi:putative zinc finger/helix-turn-helix YgiT family protein